MSATFSLLDFATAGQIFGGMVAVIMVGFPATLAVIFMATIWKRA